MSCVICGKRPGEHDLPFSQNFVGYAYLFHGSKICSLCKKLVSDEYRRSNWLLSGDQIKVLSKEDVREILKDPPREGIIYVKSGGRKYTYLGALRYSGLIIVGEDEGVFFINRERLLKLLSLAESSYAFFKKKSILLSGCPPKAWENRDLCEKIEEVRRCPEWPLLVRIV